MPMPAVKVVEVTRVAPPPAEDMVIRLSMLAAPWILLPLIQRVLLFDGQLPPMASLVASLRASLAATLARFPPLAGRIVFLPSTGDAAIDCSASSGGGVRFVVAEMEDADAGRLAGDADHDVDAFKALVPDLQIDALPLEVLAVQVTRLKGGLAVGVAMHHAVVDGRSAWRFLEAWAAACTTGVAAAGVEDEDAPTFEVALPGGQERARSTLRKYAPDLLLDPSWFPVRPNLPRRTFTVDVPYMHRLKQTISELTSSPPPSSFVAIAALTWVSFVRSKHPGAISAADDVYLFFLCDCRGRRGIKPLVSENYFGTCISGCLAKAAARDLLAEDGLAAAASKVLNAVSRAAENPLALWDWLEMCSKLPMDRLVNVSGSTRFPAYEVANFGWGAPSRTELVTMNSEGQVVLVAAKGGGGSVQASVCMHPDHIEAFSLHFLTNSFSSAHHVGGRPTTPLVRLTTLTEW